MNGVINVVLAVLMLAGLLFIFTAVSAVRDQADSGFTQLIERSR